MFNNELWQKPTAAGATGIYPYQIANSLRLNGTSQALERSFSSTPSNADAKALSFWIKRSGASGTNSAFGSTTNTKLCSSSTGSGAVADMLEINTNNPTGYSDQFHYYLASGGANYLKAKWRDPSAWIHIVWIYNSDESTTTDRIKVYINGESNTINDSNYWDNDGNNGYPSSGADTSFGLNGNEMHIGRYVYDDAGWWGGQMADFIMIDGTASISDFGETHNGVWRPKDPSGLTFGTNGFWLKFTNASNPGEDFSGNDNDFTNIGSIPASATTLDSPTFGSEGSANFPLWSPLFKGATSLSEGNTRMTGATNERGAMTSWAISTGTKFYIECLVEHVTAKNILFGIANPDIDIASYFESDSSFNGILFRANTSSSWDTCSITNGSRGSFGSNVGTTAGRVLAMTVNRVDNEIKMYLDNSLKHTISISATEEYHICCDMGGGADSSLHMNINAGHDSTGAGDFSAGSATDENGYGSFQHAPPSGFLALCTANLPTADAVDPAQTDDNYPQELFSPLLYTGNGGTNNITGLGFQPDLTWIKIRNTASNGPLVDSTRGTNNVIFSQITDAAVTSANLTAFGTDGFSLAGGLASYDPNFNGNTNTYCSWNWRANGGTTSTNSNGSTDSTVQVDPSGHFSIVKFEGQNDSWGNPETIGHGLSSAPTCMILKNYDKTDEWSVFFSDYGNASIGGSNAACNSLVLNSHVALYTNQSYKGWGGVMPTSSVFTVDGNNNNGASESIVVYCFANCEGYIKSGSYAANGNADGAFVYTGFRPAYVMIKAIDTGAEWTVYDDKRDPFNEADHVLQMDIHDAESTSLDEIDILSNGFKCLATGGRTNQSGKNYVYLAMADNPFQYATAR